MKFSRAKNHNQGFRKLSLRQIPNLQISEILHFSVNYLLIKNSFCFIYAIPSNSSGELWAYIEKSQCCKYVVDTNILLSNIFPSLIISFMKFFNCLDSFLDIRQILSTVKIQNQWDYILEHKQCVPRL